MIPTSEQQQRAKWDLLLLDIEHRSEQLRQLKSYEGWQLAFAGLTAGAALLGAGSVLGGLLVHLLAHG